MRKRIIKINCTILGHKWLVNFPSMGNKILCKRCNKKMELDLHSLMWNNVNEFSINLGTDEEIKKRWFHC